MTATETIQFTGKERDAESGVDYFGARYFGAAMGRFTSPDPVIVTSDRMKNPQQLNLYAYVANNPLRYIDPTGEILVASGDLVVSNNWICFRSCRLPSPLRRSWLLSWVHAPNLLPVSTATCASRPTQIIDANSEVTALAYDDSLDRLTSANEAGLRQTSYAYSNGPVGSQN